MQSVRDPLIKPSRSFLCWSFEVFGLIRYTSASASDNPGSEKICHMSQCHHVVYDECIVGSQWLAWALHMSARDATEGEEKR